MVQLSLEIAGVVHVRDGEVINVIYYPRQLGRAGGRVLVVLSMLVFLSVASVRLNSPCNSPCAASLAEVPAGGLGLCALLHEEAH